jgi:hypothetical protein
MQPMRVFQLLEDLEPFRSARANLLRYNGKDYVLTGEVVRVHEYLGSHGDRGDRGYAFLSTESELWEVASGVFQQVTGYAG